MKKMLIIAACFQSSASFAEDYFNPLFLGSDVAAIADLAYLNQGNDFAPGHYFLNLYVGERFIRNIDVMFYLDDKKRKVLPCFTKEMLELIPFNNEGLKKLDLDNKSPDECLKIQSILPGTSYATDIATTDLNLSIPQIYLLTSFSTLAPEKDWNDGISAYLMNYNFNGSYSKNHNSDDYQSYFLSMNNRINFGAWRFHSSSYWNEAKTGSNSQSEFHSNSVYVTRAISSIKSNLIIGQSSLASNLFDSIPYIGAALVRSDDMLAENEKGYSPPIRGIVNSRSKITIRQSGSIIYETYVDAGPYNITDVNPVGSSGDYQVEVTSASGVSTTYTIPFSTINNLLSNGNYDYSVAIGRLDQKDIHERHFVQANFSYGLPNSITAYMGTQLSDRYKAFALGFAHDFGNFGAVSIDAISSQGRLSTGEYKSGQSYRILYSKNFLSSGTAFQLTGYRYSTPGYYSFTEAAAKGVYFDEVKGQYVDRNLYGRRKSTLQVNVSQNLGDYGQIYAWGTKTDYWGTSNSTNLQFGWNKTLPILNGTIVNATFSNYKYQKKHNNSVYLSFNIPLAGRSKNYSMYAMNSTTYNTSSHDVTNNTGLYGTAFDSKLNYGLSQSLSSHGDSTSITTGNASYFADIAKLNLGLVQSSDTTQVNYGVTGSLLLHGDGVVFAREVNETAVLVEAKGAAGARITRAGENVSIGRDGYALIPYVQPYRYNDIELDPGTFSDSFDIQNKVLKTVPTYGAITKVTFDVLVGYNFLIDLKYNELPVPFGAVVTNIGNKSTSISDENGSVYLTGVEDNSTFSVRLSRDVSCSFSVKYGDNFIANMINKRSITCL